MTPERLKEIAQRQAEVSDAIARPWPADGCAFESYCRNGDADAGITAHNDRGDLLDLLRRIARGPSSLDGLKRFIEAMGRGEAPSVCLMCFEEPHAPDCPIPALFELLRTREV